MASRSTWTSTTHRSADSRYIGFVPRHLLIGHAHRVLVSVDIKGNWVPRFGQFWRALS